MKKKIIILVFATLYLCANSQNNTVQSFVNLSKIQMYQDFDQFCRIVEDFCAQVEFRKAVTDYDILAEIRAQRNKIDHVKSYAEFIYFMSGITNLILDCHAVAVLNTNMATGLGSADIDTFALSIIQKNYMEFLMTKKASAAFIQDFYHDGNYYARGKYEFINHYTNDTLDLSNFRCVEYDGRNIDEYAKSMFRIQGGLNVAWDFKHQKYYSQNLMFFGKILVVEDMATKKQYSINLDSVSLIVSNRNLKNDSLEGYWSQTCDMSKSESGRNIIYFDNFKTLYIYTNQMWDPQKEFTQKIKEIGRDKPIEKIIIDVRGNRGGGDGAWYDMLQAILKDTIDETVKLGVKNNENVKNVLKRSYGEEMLKSFNVEKTEILDDSEMLVREHKIRLIPDSNSLQFSGPVYIFQGENIYSSGHSFTSFARQVPQLISVGVPTGIIGGFGFMPWTFQLKHSKYTFKLEPAVDLTLVQTPEDVFQCIPEIELFPTLEETIRMRTMMFGEKRYSECFLIHCDYLFNQIVAK